jgi:hypothetical protein
VKDSKDKKVKFLTGYELELDGDLMAVIESLYQEVVVRKELMHTYMDMKEEIDNITGQMSSEELQSYLVESLFLNMVSYENQKLEALMEKLSEEDDEDAG